MCHAGLTPESTQDPRRALHLWASDSAVILTTHHTDAAGMLANVRDVFVPRLLTHQSAHQSPMTVSANADVTLELRIDGYLRTGTTTRIWCFRCVSGRPPQAASRSSSMASASLAPSPATPPTRAEQVPVGRHAGTEQAARGSAWPEPASPSAAAGRWRRGPAVDASSCAATHTNASSTMPRPGDRQHLAAWARLTEEAARTALRFRFTPAICSAWTTTGSSTAASPTPDMTGSCTSCGPGAT